jgi:hypothetical protein
MVLALSEPARADDCVTGQFNGSLDPSACGQTPASRCANTITQIRNAANELNRKLQSTCDRANKVQSQIAAAASLRQDDQLAKQKQVYSEAKEEYESYYQLLKDKYDSILNTLKQANGPLTTAPPDPTNADVSDPNSAERSSIRSALSSANLSQASFKTANSPHEANDDASLFAARNGAGFLKQIAAQSQYAQSQITSLQSSMGNVASNQDNLEKMKNNPNEKDASTVTGGSKDDGDNNPFDLKTLAELGAAGSGLAGLLGNKDQSSGSSPDTSTGTSTDTGASKDGSEKGPNVSKLGGAKAASAGSQSTSTAAQTALPQAARSPSSNYGMEPSGISKSPNATPTPPSTPASAKATGGGAGGMGGGSTAPTDPEAAAKQAAANAANKEQADDMQGLGGGGLGGGGPPSLGSSSPSAAAAGAADLAGVGPEAAMTDLLHEMKETADAANSIQGNGDVPMSSEDLFPRVRACYVRLMKSGLIQDGLGEKINPEDP